MLILRQARPLAAEYTLHWSIYYCILNPQWQPGVAAGADRQSLYGTTQYDRDRHHLKGFWGHETSRDVTWIHPHAQAQACWESFSSGWQPDCAGGRGDTRGRSLGYPFEMWLWGILGDRHQGFASNSRSRRRTEDGAKPGRKWQIRL